MENQKNAFFTESSKQLRTQDALRYNWMCWRLIGIQPLSLQLRIYWIFTSLLNFSGTFLYIGLYFVPLFAQDGVGDGDGSIDTLAKLLSLFSLTNVAAKQVVIFYHLRRDLPKAAQHLRALDDRAAAQAEESDYLKRQVRECHRIFFAGSSSYFICLALYALVSGLWRNLPFDGWMPFDWQHSGGYYILACTLESFSMAVLGASAASSDTYSVIFLKLLVAHLRILNARIARLGVYEEKSEIKKRELKQVENLQQLTDCVKDHIECISYYRCIQQAIADTLFVQFFSSAIVLCLAATTLIGVHRNLAQMIKFLTFLVLTLVQTAPCCWYMDEVRLELKKLTTSMYSSQWYEQQCQFRRAAIIFMQRSQKLEQMFAGNIVPVSLDTFIGILKFTFSLFTLLNKISHRPDE